MVEIGLGQQPLTVEFTAGASISSEEAVAVTADDEVSPADDTMLQETVGVATSNANAGEVAEVAILGKVPCTVSSEVTAGQIVAPGATAGQAAPLSDIDLSHDHPVQDHSHTMGTHSHTAFQTDGTDASPSADQAVLAGDGGTTGLLSGVSTSGQAAETVSTDAVDPGDTNSNGPGSTDSTTITVSQSQVLGIVTAGATAGDSATVLVGAKSG